MNKRKNKAGGNVKSYLKRMNFRVVRNFQCFRKYEKKVFNVSLLYFYITIVNLSDVNIFNALKK